MLLLLIEGFTNIQNKISKVSRVGTCDQLDGGRHIVAVDGDKTPTCQR